MDIRKYFAVTPGKEAKSSQHNTRQRNGSKRAAENPPVAKKPKLVSGVGNSLTKLKESKRIKDEPTVDTKHIRAAPDELELDGWESDDSFSDSEFIDPKPAEISATKKQEKSNLRKSKETLKKEKPQKSSQHNTSNALKSKKDGEKHLKAVKGKCFVFTGEFDQITREEAAKLTETRGGRVTTGLSGKTDYLVTGNCPGVAKTAKAETLAKCSIIDELTFLSMLEMNCKKVEEEPMKIEEPILEKVNKHATLTETTSPIMASSNISVLHDTLNQAEKLPLQLQPSNASMWVDKYKPQSIGKIIGQGSERSHASKLVLWLNDWLKHKQLGTKPPSKFGHFGSDSNGAGFHAALLSGAPGVGKTTSAVLACKQAGFTYFELNASDTRSKKTLQESVSQAVNNTSISNFYQSNHGGSKNQKHCIIMDEVDGMSGNQDRGGTQELISLIKSSLVPIICICNDRNSPKMRSLSNHCFDLKFAKPTVEQIKAAMMSICFKEGVNMSSTTLVQIIEASNRDVRQVLHNLSVWCAGINDRLSSQPTNASANKKDFKMDPFASCHLTFTRGPETKKMTLKDKSDLFFYDYSLHPLFVQENYIHADSADNNRGSPTKYLKKLAKSASRIATGDVISQLIRQDNWALLPMQAMFSSVLPGEFVGGRLRKRIDFPRWLGKFSSTNKNGRLVQEISSHMSYSVTGSRMDVAMDYLPLLRYRLTTPLLCDPPKVSDVINCMAEYELQRQDFDTVIDVTSWPGLTDPRTRLQTKVKSSFTREYNKAGLKMHYPVIPTGSAKIKRGASKSSLDDDLDEELNESSDGDEDEATLKALQVKPKKSTRSTKPPKKKSK